MKDMNTPEDDGFLGWPLKARNYPGAQTRGKCRVAHVDAPEWRGTSTCGNVD